MPNVFSRPLPLNVLQNMLQLADPVLQRTATLVNKGWEGIASREIWRSCELYNLLEVMGNLSETDGLEALWDPTEEGIDAVSNRDSGDGIRRALTTSIGLGLLLVERQADEGPA